MRIVLGSLVIALTVNVLLGVSLGLNEVVEKSSKGEIYGDSTKGTFGCNNFHGDLFYCSATEFFTTHVLFMTTIVILSSYGMSIILPFLLMLFLWRQRIKGYSTQH